ncbi:MAG: WecB/TagA/CpsF family glycosyltransferase [archaeon]
MKQKIIFQSIPENKVFKFLKLNKQRKILNFLNQHDLYQSNKEPLFRETLLEKQNINFIDGFIISAYLSITNLRKVSRTSGPILTRDFLSNAELSQNKKHFFIGLEKEDLDNLQTKFPHLKKVSSYNPPYIKDLNFSLGEIEKIAKLINEEKSDYIWVGIGCPKQNILSSLLFKKTKAQYFVNVGAAIDFLLEKKKQAPAIFRKLGVEWFYRLITDFKYSKKKVWRSLVGLRYLNQTKIEK